MVGKIFSGDVEEETEGRNLIQEVKMRVLTFRLLPFTALSLVFLLSGCATVFDLAEEDSVGFDRGYQPKKTACSGRRCEEGSAATDDDDEEADNGNIARWRTRAPTSVSYEEKRAERAIDTRDIILGMTRRQVVDSWGEPSIREVAGDGRGGHERWVYGSRFSLTGSRVVIFEDGHVAGWNR